MRAESSTVIINVPAVCDILLWDPGSMPKPSLLFYLLLFKLITCRFWDNFTYRWRLKVICTCKYTQRRKTLIWNIRFWRGCLRLVHFGKQRNEFDIHILNMSCLKCHILPLMQEFPWHELIHYKQYCLSVHEDTGLICWYKIQKSWHIVNIQPSFHLMGVIINTPPPNSANTKVQYITGVSNIVLEVYIYI